jgi:pimeloyl-[acyl-carrier protein] methyl ester esterase
MKRLLMLHGWGFPAAVFESLREQLASDFIVEIPDRPGYGDRVAQSADGLSTKYQPARLTSPTLLLGWSLGGLAALQLALDQADMVTGLVLLAATPCFVNRNDWQMGMDKDIFASFRNQVMENPVTAMQQFLRLNAAAKPDRETKAQLNELSGNVSSDTLLDGLEELENSDLRDVIKKITVPVLLLHAVDDRVVPVAASRYLHQHLENSELFEFQAGGHAFFLQNTTEVASQIRAFQ